MVLHLERASNRPATVSTEQLAEAQHLWRLAGLPGLDGFGSAFLATVLACDQALAEIVASTDLGDPASAARGAEMLIKWRDHAWAPTAG